MSFFPATQSVSSSKSRSLCSKALGKRPLGEVFHSSVDIVFEDILEIMEFSRQVRQYQKPTLKRMRKSDSNLESQNINDDSCAPSLNQETASVLLDVEGLETKSNLDNGLPWFATITASDLDKIVVSAPETISYALDALPSQVSTDSMQFYSSAANGELSTDSLLAEEEEFLTMSTKSAVGPMSMGYNQITVDSVTGEDDDGVWGNLFSIDEF